MKSVEIREIPVPFNRPVRGVVIVKGGTRVPDKRFFDKTREHLSKRTREYFSLCQEEATGEKTVREAAASPKAAFSFHELNN